MISPLNDLTAHGYTTQGHLEALRLLLQRGAAVNAADPSTGVTAYHAACAANRPECAEALVLAGCVSHGPLSH